jgi:hypothetical protein
MKKYCLILFFATVFLSKGFFAESNQVDDKNISENKQNTLTNDSKVLSSENGDPIKIFFDELLRGLKKKADSINDLFKNLKTYLGKNSYLDSQKVSILSNQGDGLVIDRGYVGAGNIVEPFYGLEPQVVITGVSEDWLPVVKSAIPEVSGFTPAQEWLLDLFLLFIDKKNDKVSKSDFIIQFNLLIIRLVNTPKYDSFSKVLDDISPKFKKLLQSIKIDNKKAVDFLDEYYIKFKNLAARHLRLMLVDGKFVDDPEYVPSNEILSGPQANELLLAIFIKALTYYYQLKFRYEQTDKGKAAAEKLKKSLEAVSKLPKKKQLKKRIDALVKYNSKLTGMDKFADKFLLVEIARFLYRSPSYKNKIASFLKPILSAIGMKLDKILITLGGKESIPEAPVDAEPINMPEIDFEF